MSRSKSMFVMMTSLFERTMYDARVLWILPSSYQPPRVRSCSGTGLNENNDAFTARSRDCSKRRIYNRGVMSSSMSKVQCRAARVRPV